MSNTETTRPATPDSINTSPLLERMDTRRSSSGSHHSLHEAASFLGRVSSSRIMREPSILVRERAAQELEERQSEWAYSKPVLVLDILWNLASVGSAVGMMAMGQEERPKMPLRVWLVGYIGLCLVHVGIIAKHLESANTVFSFIWWIVGFYWVSTSGQSLARNSPWLYWLYIIFLGFDVFCVAFACAIGMAVCCCLPCIIAILYAVADQEGASKDDIDELSKFMSRRNDENEKLSSDAHGGIMTECGTDSPIERTLSDKDAECCICLSRYEDGVELRELPCGHQFPCVCVDKWLPH